MPTQPRPNDGLNVVVITTDQQSASSLPLYGNPVARMPHLDAFAARGVVFDNAFTSCPLCVPARVSMFTGQYPSTHGSLNNQILMGSGKRHLLRLLKEKGYRTGIAGKNHCFGSDDMEYFDSIAECGHYGPIHDNGSPVPEEYGKPREYLQQCADLRSAWGSTITPFAADALGTAWTTTRAVDFLNTAAPASEPFFLWYSIADPHIPFQTCEPYASMYPLESVPLPPLRDNEMDTKPRAQQLDRAVMAGDAVDEQTIRRIRSIYYGMNTYIDDELGRFFKRMTDLDLWNRTLVIYMSDHGEYLGEHRMIRKSKAAYDCLVRIPFIVRAPDAFGLDRGSRTRTFVSLEDIMPSVLHATGTETPPEVQGRSIFSGESGGSGLSTTERDHIAGEYGVHARPWPADKPYDVCSGPLARDFRPAMKVGGYGKMQFVRTEHWKLVVYVDDRNELYHLAEDPWELENLYGTPGTELVVSELMDRLVQDIMVTTNSWIRTKEVS